MGLEAYKLIYGTRIYCGSDLGKRCKILTLYQLFFIHFLIMNRLITSQIRSGLQRSADFYL